MTSCFLLASLAAAALTVPGPAPADGGPAIREINVRPDAPVVGAGDSIRLVIDVVAKGVRGRRGVVVKVEPGAPPKRVLDEKRPPTQPPAEEEPGRFDPGTGPGEPERARPADPRPDENSPGEDRADEPWTGWDPWAGEDQAESWAGEDRSDESWAGEDRSDESWAGEDRSDESWTDRDGSEESWADRDGSEGSGTDRGRSEESGTGRGRSEESWTDRDGSGESRSGRDRSEEDGADRAKAGHVIPATMASRLVNDGWQTWRFLPDKRLNRFYPAGTWTVTVTAKGAGGAEVTEYASFQLRRETRLASVRAERDDRGVRLSGRLKRLDPRGYAGYTPFREQRVEILWRRDRSAGWERVAEATTSGKGAFSRTVSARDGGEWRVHFPGTGHYAADVSKVRSI